MDIMQRKDLVVFVLIIILAFLIGNNAIYKRGLTKIAFIKSQIEEEKKKNEILGHIGTIDRKLKLYQKRSLATTEVTQLLDRLSELAEEAGIRIETFNPLPVVYTEQYVELPVKLPLRCGYHQLGQFLSLIESNQEFIWVKELRMQKPTVVDPQQIMIPKVDLAVSGLYLKK